MRFNDHHSHRDKALLRLERELNRLCRAQWHAPVVPLERPYQSGWIKSFGLREDALHHPDIAVFRGVLAVVDRQIRSRNRDFLDRTGQPIVLRPRILDLREWRKLAWPFRYQRLFAHGNWPDDHFPTWAQRVWRHRKMGFKLMSTWWLMEQVRPCLITHQRVDLPDVRSRIAEIENHLRHRLGWKRLRWLHGQRAHWRDETEPLSVRRVSSDLIAQRENHT